MHPDPELTPLTCLFICWRNGSLANDVRDVWQKGHSLSALHTGVPTVRSSLFDSDPSAMSKTGKTGWGKLGAKVGAALRILLCISIDLWCCTLRQQL
jgi:hypothetical protein